MSTVRRTHVRCDGYGEALDTIPTPERKELLRECSYSRDAYGSLNAKAELKEAAREGWTRSGGKDYCPPCTKRKAGEQ